ncbi:hypothetical protein HPP92_006933 [Vanilla planifolia]|uniref:HMA domain-containing protein n=1 Tax=Vanilla planifolia TaxID=51239 RepID=A0A835RD54_VANPL|nr:hypothetical protein HPP92_006933 [Vanilla planifolia]
MAIHIIAWPSTHLIHILPSMSTRKPLFYSRNPPLFPHSLSNSDSEEGQGDTERVLRRESMGKGEKCDDKEKVQKVQAEGQRDCGGKKEQGPISVVLKVEMHCEGCAQEVRRCVRGFKGVEAVATDLVAHKVTIIGKVNPVELRERLERRTHKNVELVSPAVSGKESSKDGGKGDNQNPGKPKDQKKADDRKPKEPAVTTVVLKVRLHCDGCIKRIRKHIYKIKGVDNVSIDSEKDLVTVKGTMDAKTLPELLTAKLKRGVELVNPKKDGDGNKEKKSEGPTSTDGKKKDGEEASKAVRGAAPLTTEANTMAFYGGGYGDYPYRVEMVHAPQLFSDENPNACSIM